MSGRDIQFVSAGVVQDVLPECNLTGEQRTLNIAATCSNAHNADLISLIEID
jgi:hypothetical protein